MFLSKYTEARLVFRPELSSFQIEIIFCHRRILKNLDFGIHSACLYLHIRAEERVQQSVSLCFLIYMKYVRLREKR